MDPDWTVSSASISLISAQAACLDSVLSVNSKHCVPFFTRAALKQSTVNNTPLLDMFLHHVAAPGNNKFQLLPHIIKTAYKITGLLNLSLTRLNDGASTCIPQIIVQDLEHSCHQFFKLLSNWSCGALKHFVLWWEFGPLCHTHCLCMCVSMCHRVFVLSKVDVV